MLYVQLCKPEKREGVRLDLEVENKIPTET